MDSGLSVRSWAKRSYGMRRRSSGAVVFLGSALAVLACAGSAGPAGPIRESTFEATFRQSIDLGDEKIEMEGVGVWYPDKRGWKDLKDAWQPGLGVGTLYGGLVLTNSRLVFAEWLGGHYEQVLSLPYTDILSVELTKELGHTPMLVVERKNLTFQSFLFMSRGVIDQSKTEKAAELIQGRLVPQTLR